VLLRLYVCFPVHYAVSNWISSLSFDSTGKFLAVGYNCGQVVVLKQQPDEQTYQLYTEFKSHDSEFDFLTSMEIEEKINAIRWFPFPQRDTQRLLTTNGTLLSIENVAPISFALQFQHLRRLLAPPPFGTWGVNAPCIVRFSTPNRL